MTVHELHDALNLLPGDLLPAADRLRTGPGPKVIPWKRILPMAACLALLILGAGQMLFGETPDHIVKKEPAAEAPAAMAPAPEDQKVTADEILPETPAEDAAGSKTGMEEEYFTDHSHSFAEESDRTANSSGYCGNMTASVWIGGEEFAISGSDAVILTDILVNLDYDPDRICRCMAQITVDTELLTGIEVSLEQAFARCEKGQAGLTQTQVETIRRILDSI